MALLVYGFLALFVAFIGGLMVGLSCADEPDDMTESTHPAHRTDHHHG